MMAFELAGRKISKIGIIGSGQIGPDIALHFAETLSAQGVTVAVVDIDDGALARGRKKLDKKVAKVVERGRLKQAQADAITGAVTFTSDYSVLAGAELVVEAATEDLQIKRKIFAQLEAQVSAAAILTSNSSHLEPEVIFAELKDSSRTAVTHYFFPAERNPVVEVVAGQATSAATVDFLMRFYELAGKLPIKVKSRYGYAVDPVFEGLFLAAALAVEKGLADHKQVDVVCQKALGQGVGPFTAMNLTGGNPLTNVGLDHYTSKIMPWYRSPDSLKAQLAKNEPWPAAARGEQVDVDDATSARVSDWMTGAYFGIACEVIDAGLITPSDFDQALGLALAMKPAISMINKMGTAKALALVEKFAAENDGFKVSTTLKTLAAANKPFELPWVEREDRDGVAVLTIKRFKVLNALNRQVVGELKAHVETIATDKTISGVVIRGFGTRAFAAGADINELAALKTIPEGIATAQNGQAALRVIEKLNKPVVAAMGGLAFGGGCELAMSCHARLAAKGQKVFAGQPEPNLGIIPGYGGTQRLPRWVGLKAAWPMIRSGAPISSAMAAEIGLIRGEVPATSLLDEAIKLVKDVAAGTVKLTPIAEGPIEIPSELPEVELGHLSTKIDQIICQVTLDGAKTTLDEGLRIEAEGFGECMKAEDYRIGMDNFIKNGPKKPAEFKHR